MEFTPKSIWLDCDPGHDDAIAISLAAHSPSLKLLGVSTVGGNQSIEKVTKNALCFLAAIGNSHVQVFRGQENPLMRRAVPCPDIHGNSGLDRLDGDVDFWDSHMTAVDPPAAPHIFAAIQAEFQRTQQPVYLVCTACLTNAALLLVLYPQVKPMIKLVLMGGSLGKGNTGSVAEYNIQHDPEAAKIVFESGVDLTMVPLDVTHTALVTPEVLQQLVGHLGSNFGALVRGLLLFFGSTYKRVFGFEFPPLHDPLAVAYVLDPSKFSTELHRVDVETLSELGAGQTVCDFWSTSGRPKNVRVALAVDLDWFWTELAEALARADRVSPLNTSLSS
jgi:inosine-uridine nucleoside N-ribohydrolase